jgi:hypothetical protein
MPIVKFPTAYVPSPTQPGPVSLGTVFIGQPELDPLVLENRIPVTVIQEDGNEVAVAPSAQPLTLSAGGAFLFQGSVVQIRTTTNFSMAIFNSANVLEYYFPSVASSETIESGNVGLIAQNTTPTPIPGVGQVYTKIFEGVAELFYLDSEGREVRITNKGELAVNLSQTDLTVGSLRTLAFVRGKKVVVNVVGGIAVIDWEAGTTYVLSITGTTDIQLINMPNTANDETQVIALDIRMTGTQTVSVTSDYTILKPDDLSLALTPNGIDYYICESHTGTELIISPLRNFVPASVTP